jgi:hypothetical protein
VAVVVEAMTALVLEDFFLLQAARGGFPQN